jgi:hypothetical protein
MFLDGFGFFFTVFAKISHYKYYIYLGKLQLSYTLARIFTMRRGWENDRREGGRTNCSRGEFPP